MRGVSARLLVAALPLWVAAESAEATTFTFTSGYATLSATFNGNPILPINPAPTIPLSGTQVTFVTSPSPSLVSFDFDAAAPPAIPLGGPLAGHSITLSNVQIAPGPGYTNLSVTGGPSNFNYTVSPVAVSSTVAVSGPVVNVAPFNYSGTFPSLSGLVQLGTGTITLSGITLGVINVPAALPVFPGGNVTVKADIVFNGVPEPGTALLLGGGLAGIAAAGRRRRSS